MSANWAEIREVRPHPAPLRYTMGTHPGALRRAVGVLALSSGKREHNRHYDWAQLHREYVMGIKQDPEPGNEVGIHWPTFRELAKRHGLDTDSQIRAVAARESWGVQRAEFQSEYESELRSHRRQIMLDRAVEFHEQSFAVASQGVELVFALVSEILATAVRELDESDEQTTRRERSKSDVSARELLDLSRTLANFHKAGREALGEDLASRRSTEREHLEGHLRTR